MEKISFSNLGKRIKALVASTDKGTPIEVIVELKGVSYPIRLTLSHKYSGNLLVTYNGAVSRARAADGVVFQRSSWTPLIRANVLQFCDPTLLSHKGMAIGWGQLNHDVFGIEQYMEILSEVRNHIALPAAEQTIHFGSSAGGFQALIAASLDRGSMALVNNPQFDWTYYPVTAAVNRVAKNVLGRSSIEDLRNNLPHRCSAAAYFELNGNVPRMRLLINTQSNSDFSDQLPRFMSDLGKSSWLDINRDIEIRLYSHAGTGHNPIHKGHSLNEMNEAIRGLRKPSNAK